MIKVGNLGKVASDIDHWFEQVEAQVKRRAINTTIAALSFLTNQSPQYSGDFVANWKVNIGVPDLSFEPHVLGSSGASKYIPGFDVKARGDREGIDYAIARGQIAIARIAFGDKVFITNSAVHDDPYAVMIENNQIKFRPVNAGAGELIKRFINVAEAAGGKI